MNNQDINISHDQIRASARAGINLLNRDSTLVPGSLRQQLAVLEVVLGNILSGRFMVVPSAPTGVELGPKPDTDADAEPGVEETKPADAKTGAKPNGRPPRKLK